MTEDLTPQQNEELRRLYLRYRAEERRAAASPCPDPMLMASYIDGMATPDEVARVEEHLLHCVDCREGVADIREMLANPVEPEPVAPAMLERLKTVVLRAVEEENRRKRESRKSFQINPAEARRQPGPSSPEGLAGWFPWRSCGPESAQTRPRFRIRYLAAACFLLLALPALAYLVPLAWKAVFAPAPSSQSDTISTTPGACTPREVGPFVSAKGKTPATAETPRDKRIPLTPLRAWSPTLDPALKRAIGDFAVKAEVEAMLPRTEAAYEAWARKEYPHVLWLYDVLTRPEYGICWNGDPVNVPAWATRLYAGTPPESRPKGWGALLIYSGEILRFDYPTALGELNVKPRIEAVQLAAAVAGFEAELSPVERGEGVGRAGGISLPGLAWAGKNTADADLSRLRLTRSGARSCPRFLPEEEKDILDGYAAEIAQSPAQARSVLVYLLISSTIAKEAAVAAEQRSLEYLADQTFECLERLMSRGEPGDAGCPADLLRSDLERVLWQRKEVKAGLAP